MITTNLCIQPPTALIQNQDYNGFLQDILTLNATTPKAQSPLGGGWTALGLVVSINGYYTQSFVQVFPQSYNPFEYRGPVRLGFQVATEL